VIRTVATWTKGAVAGMGGACAHAQAGYRHATTKQRADNDPRQGAIGIHVRIVR
jgi:hypothetical protein